VRVTEEETSVVSLPVERVTAAMRNTRANSTEDGKNNAILSRKKEHLN